MVGNLDDPISEQQVQRLVELAKTRRDFKAWSRPKHDVVWLLEMARDRDHRKDAMEALQAIVSDDSVGDAKRMMLKAVSQCAQHLTKGGVEGTGSARQTASVVEDPKGHKLWVFKPPTTEQGPVNRHPWEGVLSGVTVGEFAAGAGCFMATAIGVGMRGEWLAESDDTTRALAMENCPSVKQELRSIYDRDPLDLPWVHVLLGGACCQPFSRAGKQQAWEDDRAYTTIRFMHNMAAMRPWMAVSENVRALLTVKKGAVWKVVKGVLQRLGYVVNPVMV